MEEQQQQQQQEEEGALSLLLPPPLLPRSTLSLIPSPPPLSSPCTRSYSSRIASKLPQRASARRLLLERRKASASRQPQTLSRAPAPASPRPPLPPPPPSAALAAATAGRAQRLPRRGVPPQRHRDVPSPLLVRAQLRPVRARDRDHGPALGPEQGPLEPRAADGRRRRVGEKVRGPVELDARPWRPAARRRRRRAPRLGAPV